MSNDQIKPEWIRPADVKTHFGISRSKAYELMNDGKIKSITLRERGQKNGTRLISYDSINSYFQSLMEAPGDGLAN